MMLDTYIIFVIFAPRTRFLFIFCATQKCENRNKMNFASKQCKSLQKSIHCKFVTCRKVCNKEQFVIDLQSQNYSTQQTILPCGARLLVMKSNFVPHDHQQFPCGAKLLHMKFFAPRTMSAASATNMMYAPHPKNLSLTSKFTQLKGVSKVTFLWPNNAAGLAG